MSASVKDRSNVIQRNRDRRLVTLWTQHVPTQEIAYKLGMRYKSSVSHAAKRLGLEPRRGNRSNNLATKANADRRLRQTRGEAQMLANLERAVLTDHGPVPVWYRCEICEGRSATPVHAGHTQEEVA
jgi:hypothetical protein